MGKHQIFNSLTYFTLFCILVKKKKNKNRSDFLKSGKKKDLLRNEDLQYHKDLLVSNLLIDYLILLNG